MTGDVFEEDPFGIDLADDPGDVWPEVAFVVGTLALSGLAEGLAGVSGEDGVEGAAEGCCVEGGDVVPDGGRGEISGPLGGDENGSWVFFDFDPHSGSEGRFGQVEPHVEPAASATKAKAVFWSGR